MRFSLTTLLLITGLATEAVSAGYINDITSRAVTQRDEIVKDVTKVHQGFKQQKELIKQNLPKYQAIVEKIKNQQRSRSPNSQIKKPLEAMVFVSLGMPDLSLKQIIHDAKRYQVPVVIRGLYENSFRKTAEKIFNLAKEKNAGGILINPLWFKQYDIKQVPAVVINKNDNEFDVIYGNIPLKRALTIIADKGEAATVAKAILNRGGA